MTGDARYFYGITKAGAPLPTAESDGALEPVEVGGLQAVCSPLPDDAFATDDPVRLEELVRRHDAVLRGIFSHAPVLPVRFGTVLGSPEDLRRLLDEHQDALLGQLQAVEGAAEWGVRIACGPDRLAEHVLRTSEEVRQVDAEIAASSSGKAYMLRKRREVLLRDATARFRERSVEACIEALGSTALEVRDLRAEAAEVGAVTDGVIASLACLVPQANAAAFERAVAGLQEAYGEQGLAFSVSGPWPPYSFVDIQL